MSILKDRYNGCKVKYTAAGREEGGALSSCPRGAAWVPPGVSTQLPEDARDQPCDYACNFPAAAPGAAPASSSVAARIAAFQTLPSAGCPSTECPSGTGVTVTLLLMYTILLL